MNMMIMIKKINTNNGKMELVVTADSRLEKVIIEGTPIDTGNSTFKFYINEIELDYLLEYLQECKRLLYE
jgi:uncharacterized protein YaaQ